jgi:hypothetical protein
METIGEKTIATAKEMLGDLLASYAGQINKAYLGQDQALSINLSLKFQPHPKGGVEMTYGIKFIESQIKDGDVVIIDEKQMELPL